MAGTAMLACLLCLPTNSMASDIADRVKDVDGRHYVLVFDEEFAEPMGFPNSKFLTHYKMWGGLRTLAGNKEKQLYVDREYALPDGKNFALDPFSVVSGALRIEADRASTAFKRATGYSYVSGLITTENSFAQAYGYFEVRAQMPKGAGLWPAIWMVGKTHKQHLEIDIVEVLGQQPRKLYCSGAGIHTWMTKVDSSDGFHLYAVEWSKKKVIWYVDDVPAAETPTPERFKVAMYLIVNLAVGGSWGGDPDSKTVFPATMLVDYIRIYRRK